MTQDPRASAKPVVIPAAGPAIASVEPFHAIAISRIAHELAPALAAAGRAVIHMEFGQPSTSAPAAAIAEAHHVLDTEAMGYWESNPLKERIAQSYRERYGVAVDREQVILTCGASPAFVLALSCLFAPGARVALARPGYVAYRNTLRALYLDPVELGCGPAERFQLTAAALEALDPAPAGVIIASPANPTGTIIARAELAAIVAVCRRRGIRIVSDEIYHGLSFGEPAASILEFAADAFVVNSFSKYFSMPGWRLGWTVVPPDSIDAARARMGNLFLTPPVIAQRAGLVAFDCAAELDGHVRTYARNRSLMLQALPALGLGTVAPPDGAFYLYADIGHLTHDSLAFCERLLRDTGVCTAPGIDFDPQDGARFMRFSFAVSTPLVEAAIARMIPWFAQRTG
ncbi:MAG TPA: aminotransferase class I/II-fold pyridoxal phosphate-dependent enzyme [Novosphingobium sp.]